jgi:hypothetical protein
MPEVIDAPAPRRRTGSAPSIKSERSRPGVVKRITAGLDSELSKFTAA